MISARAQRAVSVLVLVMVVTGCAAGSAVTREAGDAAMNSIAERYVRLVLAVGQHDDAYVDAYYGPASWQQEVAAAGKRPLGELRAEAAALRAAIGATPVPEAELPRLRREYLARQLEAVEGRIRMLQGERFSFDEESRLLYDAQAVRRPESYFQNLLVELGRLLPGSDPLPQRVEAFRRNFVIPPARLDTVFRAAIAEAKRRTAAHVALPVGDSFRMEFVTNKSWSGYNWYQGNAHSLIQFNTDLPIFIERAIDVGAHEAYPGHHLYNALLEQNLVRERGWMEYSVYPLYSPQSLIAEGSANYGVDITFTEAERMQFERDVLFPLAGLDPARVEEYHAVLRILDALKYGETEAARRYLDGEIDRDAAAAWLTQYTLSSPERSQQRVRFFDEYRSYTINYTLGKDIVREYVERRGGTDRDARWRVFIELLSTPRLPSALR